MYAGLKLKGQFRFDLYDKNKNLLKSSDYIDNFITNSGLVYPVHFAFADCFRFLSVGSGDLLNNINFPNDTTGLEIPIPEFSYIGSRNNYDSAASTNYSPIPSCGYRFPQENVVELYRGWTLPNNSGGEDGQFKNDGTIKELMVSPGRPYVIAIDEINPSITKKLCSCSENSGAFYGKDCSAIAEYYNFINNKQSNRLRICDATNAFARVVLDNANEINYVSGSFLNVTYKLTISVNSGISYQKTSYNNTVSVDGNLSGSWNFYKGITQLGLKLINDEPGILSENPPFGPQGPRLQHYDYDSPSSSYYFSKEYGESFIPPHGIPLEPSVSNIKKLNEEINNLFYYFSEDNTQFLISESGGKFYKTGEFAPWNIYNLYKTYSSGDYAYTGNISYQYINQIPNSGKLLNETSFWKKLDEFRVISVLNNGIKKFKNDTIKSLSEKSNYWSLNSNEYNIRFQNSQIPNSGDVLEQTNFTGRHIYDFTKNDPTISSIIKTTNNRKIILEKIIGYNIYESTKDFIIKSLVGAYKDIDYPAESINKTNYVPFYDSLFSGSGENIFLPKIITGNKNYDSTNNNTGAFVSGVNSSKYFYLSSDQGRRLRPSLYTALSWSTDCPSSANGCP